MLDDGIFELPLKQRIEEIRKAKPIVKFPKTLKLPRFGLTVQDSPEEVERYAEALLEYAELRRNFLANYEAANAAYEEAKPLCASIEKQVTDLIFNDVGLSQLNLSEKKVAKLWQKAWDDASNEDEAISNLRELVELFED
jgi:hypothetical protein